jgi:hypothetical protein
MVTKGYRRRVYDRVGNRISGFDAHVADPSNQVIGKAFAFIHGEDFDRMGLIVGP